MNDESCGCSCRDCKFEDIHHCNRPECGYTKYLRYQRESAARVEAKAPKPIGDSVEMLEGLRVHFHKITDPASKARLLEWAQFLKSTAELPPEIRDAQRAAKSLELFGRADYDRRGVTRREAAGR